MKRVALVLGVANRKSIAWACVESLLERNFDHVFISYQSERFKNSIEVMVHDINSELGRNKVMKSVSSFSCDVTKEDDLQRLFGQQIPEYFHSVSADINAIKLDAIVHSIAYAPADSMKTNSEFPLLHTSKESYEISHEVSAYSLLSVARNALPLLSCSQNSVQNKIDIPRSSSITALTYLGSSKAIRNYNVMGLAKASLEAGIRGLALELSPPPHSIRVNGVSAGPINSFASRGIRDFIVMKKEAEERSFLKRSIFPQEVGNTVAFLAGPDASGITGQVVFCDGGYSVAG